MDHVVATFRHLYPKLDRNGVYMVEDMHTSYMKKYGGGLCREGTFIELCKHLIDELNGTYARIASEYTHSTLSMHFYDSIVAFERGKLGERKGLMVPEPTRNG
jgi:hypothetical protein